MELSELFTESAREVLPLARKKGLVSYFDYDGPCIELHNRDPALRGAIHRVLLALTDCLDSGFLMFCARASEPVDGSSEVTICAAGSGRAASQSCVQDILQRLKMQIEPPAPLARSTDLPPRRASVRATGTCPVIAAEAWFRYDEGEGMILSMTLRLPATLRPGIEPLPDAAGVMAWLVCAIPGELDSLDARLTRLGWQVRMFGSIDEARARLEAEHALDHPLPMLLVVAESSGAELDEMEAIAAALPAIWCVLAVLAGSPALERRAATAIDIRPLPLSPGELERFTAHVDVRTSTPASLETSPSPLYLQERRLVLVVDDSEINQMVARGQLGALGYEVDMAANGEEALQHCRERPPDMVLMDVDMPVMDGLEATRRLRAWQRVGTVPPFPIVAATCTSDDSARRRECLESGMAGYLSKPLDLRRLADEIHRVLPDRPGP